MAAVHFTIMPCKPNTAHGALLDVSFGIIFRNPLETNHVKKCLEKHFYAGTLLNTNETLSLNNFLSYFVIFPLLFSLSFY